MNISDTPFFKAPSNLPTPLFLWEQSEPPLLAKISKIQTLQLL